MGDPDWVDVWTLLNMGIIPASYVSLPGVVSSNIMKSIYKNYMKQKWSNMLSKNPINGFSKTNNFATAKFWEGLTTCVSWLSKSLKTSNGHLFFEMISIQDEYTNPDTIGLRWVNDHIRIPHYKWTTMDPYIRIILCEDRWKT